MAKDYFSNKLVLSRNFKSNLDVYLCKVFLDRNAWMFQTKKKYMYDIDPLAVKKSQTIFKIINPIVQSIDQDKYTSAFDNTYLP